MTYRRRHYSRLQNIVYGVAFAVIVLSCITSFFIKPIIQNGSKETITVVIGSTEVKTKSGEETQTYLVNVVFPNGNTEVLQSSDSLVHGKWNSADVYFKLKDNPGKIFKLTVVGKRVPFLSWNRNILTIEGPIEQ